MLLLLLGIGLGLGAGYFYNKYRSNIYEKQILILEQATKELKYKLSQLENKEDIIREEVEREQANKTSDEIVKYWVEHYTRARNTPRPGRGV